MFIFGELSVKPGEVDTTKKPVLSTPCLLKGEVQGEKIIDIACGALHSLLLSGNNRQ